MEVSIMTHHTHTVKPRPSAELGLVNVDARFAAEFSLLADVDPEVLNLRSELADNAMELRAAQIRATAAEAERDAAVKTAARLQKTAGHLAQLGAWEAERAQLLGVLARMVAAVMNGDAEQLSEALDLLDAEDIQVPVSRGSLAVAA
jgi:D-arabinose 1-dehydrogenase-like Zn-dependent alcohol dehydrogenase